MTPPSSHPRESWFPSHERQPMTNPFLASSMTQRLHDLLRGVAGSIGWGRVEHIDRADGAHVRVAAPATASRPEPQGEISCSPVERQEIDAATNGLGTRIAAVGNRPACEPPLAGNQRRTSSPAARAADLCGVRILFVDDDEAVRRVVGAMLERLSATAAVVSSPLEALRLVREDAHRFDVLVTDLTMPEMTGHQLFLRVRELSPALPVVIISGDSLDAKIAACLEKGARSFLPKPFTITRFAQAIQEACDPGPTRS